MEMGMRVITSADDLIPFIQSFNTDSNNVDLSVASKEAELDLEYFLEEAKKNNPNNLGAIVQSFMSNVQDIYISHVDAGFVYTAINNCTAYVVTFAYTDQYQ